MSKKSEPSLEIRLLRCERGFVIIKGASGGIFDSGLMQSMLAFDHIQDAAKWIVAEYAAGELD